MNINIIYACKTLASPNLYIFTTCSSEIDVIKNIGDHSRQSVQVKPVYLKTKKRANFGKFWKKIFKIGKKGKTWQKFT